MKRFDVTLLFCKGGVYSCRFFAVSRIAAKAQAMRWARDCGFVGAIKKAEVIEITVEVVEIGVKLNKRQKCPTGFYGYALHHKGLSGI